MENGYQWSVGVADLLSFIDLVAFFSAVSLWSLIGTMLAYVLCAVVVVSASASEEKEKEKETCTAEASAVWAALDAKQKKKKAGALYFAAKKGEKDTVMQLLDQAVEPDYYKVNYAHTVRLWGVGGVCKRLVEAFRTTLKPCGDGPNLC